MLAPALIATQGWCSTEAEAAYDRARELCERLEDAPQLVAVLFGMSAMHELRADYQKCQALIEQRLGLPSCQPKKDFVLESHDLLACSLFHQGAFFLLFSGPSRG